MLHALALCDYETGGEFRCVAAFPLPMDSRLCSVWFANTPGGIDKFVGLWFPFSL